MRNRWHWLRAAILVVLCCSQAIPFSPAMATSATLSSVPSVQTVSPGGTFDVIIQIDVDFQARACQFSLNWDVTKIQCISVEQGGFFQDFAQAHNGILLVDPSSPAFDNNTGVFPSQGSLITWMEGGDLEVHEGISEMKVLGPTGAGSVYVLHMSAKEGTSGTATFTLSEAIVNDNSTPTAQEITPTIVNGQINISQDSGTTAELPTITSFSPASGGMGTSVVITGTNFIDNNGQNPATAVKFGATDAESFTVDSATQITAIVGNGSTGNVSVTAPGGTAVSTGEFTYTTTTVSPPRITGFEPTSAGQGTDVTITGRYLTGATSVKFGSIPAVIKSNTNTQIVATVGNGASGEVVVTTPGGIHAKSGFTFILTNSVTTTNTGTGTVTSTPALTSTAPDTPETTNIPVDPLMYETPSNSSVQTIITTPTVSAPVTAPQSALKQTSSTTEKSSSLVSKPVVSSIYPTIDISQKMDSGGRIKDTIQKTNISYDGVKLLAGIEIKNGTRILTRDGESVSEITIQPATILPTLPTGEIIIGLALKFEPSGATFSEPLTVLFDYDIQSLPSNTKENNLRLVCYDTETSQWSNCDYTVDTENNRIVAHISHFSLFAVMSPAGGGIAWNLAGTIILVELLAASIAIYLVLRRKRHALVPAAITAGRESAKLAVTTADAENLSRNQPRSVIEWDELLRENMKRNKGPFKTSLRVIGGKVIIPREGESSDIELVNTPNSQIEISLEYDPDLHPQVSAKINVFNTVSEKEKTREINKTKELNK